MGDVVTLWPYCKYSNSFLSLSSSDVPAVEFIMIFLRLAKSFQQFLKYVYPAFSVPGSRLDVQRTPRLNTLEGNPVQLGRGGTLFDVKGDVAI